MPERSASPGPDAVKAAQAEAAAGRLLDRARGHGVGGSDALVVAARLRRLALRPDRAGEEGQDEAGGAAYAAPALLANVDRKFPQSGLSPRTKSDAGRVEWARGMNALTTRSRDHGYLLLTMIGPRRFTRLEAVVGPSSG